MFSIRRGIRDCSTKAKSSNCYSTNHSWDSTLVGILVYYFGVNTGTKVLFHRTASDGLASGRLLLSYRRCDGSWAIWNNCL